jgi:hypothetical protein
MHDSVIKELAAISGPSHLLTSHEECWTYAYDATDRAHMPDAVVLTSFLTHSLGTRGKTHIKRGKTHHYLVTKHEIMDRMK